MVKNSFKYLKITMPLILLLTMIAIFFYNKLKTILSGFIKLVDFKEKYK